jgi:hypothetical protein
VQIDYNPAGPVADEFHRSNAFVRGLMGPVGSSKSSVCCMEMFTRACEQKPSGGVRRTRWAVLRNTYPELKSTTIKTWVEWFPFCQMKWDAPISSIIDLPLPDGTRVHMEVYFYALERPEDVDKLGSLEITGGWINEAREVAKPILDKLTERVGRYPPKRIGCTWRGVLLDTNPPDDDSWYYKLAEKDDDELIEQTRQAELKLRELGQLSPTQSLYEFFKQPGGLIQVNGQYEPNPKAENIDNLDGGYGYYFRQLVGKKRNWIRAQLMGQYAPTAAGKPVYEDEYNDELHCREVNVIKQLPIIIGQDYGRTPAAALCQQTKRGQFRIFDEVVSEGMGIRVFARDVLKPYLAQNYRDFQIIIVGDPSGNDKRDTEETTCFQILAEEGLVAVPALTNELLARIEALSLPMSRMIDGQPGFVISPKARIIRKGLNGGYCYERVNVGGERYREIPAKNPFSHPVEAAQYACLHARHFNIDESWGKPIQYPKNSGVV